MPRPQPCSLHTLLPALALLLLLPACAPRLRTSAWVVRFDLDSPAEVASVCSEARRAGFDQLLVQVRGRADALYRSDIAPRAENLAAAPVDFDPLAQLLTDCAPLPLHAWLNVFYLWGGASPPENPNHPGHPSQPWILSDNSGRPVSSYSAREKRLGWIEGTYADPASAEYRALFVAVVRELLARYPPVAGIHLDFMRYPGPGYGKSEVLSERFEQIGGIDPRLLPERLSAEAITAWLDGTQPPADRVLTTAALFWNEFRAGQVTQLLRDVRQAVDQDGAPGTALSVAVFPEASAAYLENGQEWQAWASEGLLDALYPMAYFGDTDRAGNQLREIAHTPRASEVALWAGLGASDKGPEQLGEEARIAGEYGYDGVSIFSLGHLLKEGAAKAGVEATHAPRHTPVPKTNLAWNTRLITASDALQPPDLQALKSIASKALGGVALSDDLETKLALRLQEYDQARQQAIPKILKHLERSPIALPTRLEMGGIFRYANPMDSPARWQEQEALCEKARQRLLAGDELATVAKEMSQDGTRTMGGLLALRFLDPLNPQDQELGHLAPNEISRVMRVTNGFWCYRLETRSPDRQTTFSEAPWEAKRILFRRAFSEAMETGKRL